MRRGASQRSVAKRFRVALRTVQHWLARARGQRLDRADFSNRPSAPRRTQRLSRKLETRILDLRRWLKEDSILGEYGAVAIRREMRQRGTKHLPSIRTIGRVLARCGALDSRRRIRRPPPLKGWYLPKTAARKAELDSFDTIEGLAIRGGPHLTIFTGISLFGGLSLAVPETRLTAGKIVDLLLAHWKKHGLPVYAQFDNEQRFTGPRQHRDAIGRVIRTCLSLGVIPVFAPPNETGFQAAIEGFNALWQAKVWRRFEHGSVCALRGRSRRYIAALRQRRGKRAADAPPRRRFPNPWKLDLQQSPQGTIVFLRRSDDRGRVTILGHSFLVDRQWVHRLVRAEVDLDQNVIRFYALRRREPTQQPLLATTTYTLPKRRFQE